ncbi:hypothetical protein AVKW3434_07540 [Acidovorax sp. SUPP3434]|uniref:hypothetical protein n=1 Tax=Acidovorax sp. SUPP3434 TaxID=2920880 RepID=UPI0023DE3711|nr:hypothetical protein [Acidovorax sp. SUPP3434]GKS99218.1 hypothetical protein AVKW3434_07540 [Acidovorax sp. SUPP3434]
MQNDSFGGIPVTTDSFGGQLADVDQPKRRRTLASVANDTVIEAANAAAGGVSAAANFVRPGNAVSGWIDKNIVEAGEANQSDAVKAEKQRFRQDVANASGVVDEVGAVGRYVVNNPLQAAAQAVGSFAGPGAAVKGGRTLASIAGLNAARGGLAGGAAAGAAMAGGDAAGTAYEQSTKAGATDEQGVAAAREDIAKFNEKNPNRRIQAMQLAQSVNKRQKRIREAEEGVYLPSKRRDALEAGRFAAPD